MAKTKESIVSLADEFIRMRGFNAFSYADISKPLGIKNAAIHYHFPTKSDLAEAVAYSHIQNLEQFIEKVSDRDELTQIKFFLNYYSSIQLSGKVCVVGAFATDWNSMEDTVQMKVKEFADLLLNWLTETLTRGRDKNLLTFNAPAKTEALRIITNMLAATQLARITGGDDFKAVKDSIIEELQN